MLASWLLLILGIGLLVFPAPHPASLFRREIPGPGMEGHNLIEMMKCWQNWVDLIRAGAGAWILTHFPLAIGSWFQGGVNRVALMAQMIILTSGVIVQCIRFRREFRVVAPCFYLQGVTLAFSWPELGLFAVLAAWTLTFARKNVDWLLPGLAVALALGGYLLQGVTMPVLFNTALVCVPWLLSILFFKPLLFLKRSNAFRRTSSAG